jgi:nucleotide-binding universal stress UspA family protein
VFKHIVVGCDGTPEARDAVALGAQIASATGAGLSLIGVFPPTFLPIPGVTDRKTLRAEAMQSLRRERDRFAPAALIHVAADTSVSRAVRRYAERWHADLVIIGSSRSAPPGHVHVGRHGRQLIDDSPFSLGIAARGLHEHERRLREIGVGYDGGPESEGALALAAELARATNAELQVRDVVEDRVPPLTPEQWVALEDWDHSHVWEQARMSALADAQAAVSRLGVRAQASATLGDPGYELRALTESVDLMVVGSRRWGTVARLVTGGVGETLVRDASCSIVIVPRPGRARRGHIPQQRGDRYVGTPS